LFEGTIQTFKDSQNVIQKRTDSGRVKVHVRRNINHEHSEIFKGVSYYVD